MTVLIVEDSIALSDNVAEFLRKEGMCCDQAFTYAEALKKIHLFEYDCLLLDLMLPDGNRLDLLEEIRKINSEAGIIILSAKDALEDKIQGLARGADDYLSKPFHLRELSMRIHSVRRRRVFDVGSNIMQSNGLEINLLTRTASYHGESIQLTRPEFDLLLYLVGNANRILSKNSIALHLTGGMAEMPDSSDFTYTHIRNLKRKKKKKGLSHCIQNVYGLGYRWLTKEQ